jgi:hypothetical protein
MALVEVDGCIYDEQELRSSHGFEALDPVGREAFVNHRHVSGDDRHVIAGRIVEAWAEEMRRRWPDREFRIYRDRQPNEVLVRFHLIRPGIPNWCEEGLEIITINEAPLDSQGQTA